jgi:hypothetical protein
MVFWNNDAVLALALLVFVAAYLDLYWRIVRFRSPRWMISRSVRAARMSEQAKF